MRMVAAAAAGCAVFVRVMVLMLPAAAFMVMRMSMRAVSAVLMLVSLPVFVLMSVKEPPHVKPLPEPVNRRKTLFMAARGLMRHKDVGSLTQEVVVNRRED